VLVTLTVLSIVVELVEGITVLDVDIKPILECSSSQEEPECKATRNKRLVLS
jgi:hypothetical protein